MTTIRELFVKLGVRTDKKDWDRAEKLIGQTKKGLLALSGAAGGAVTGLLFLARQVAGVGDELAKTAIGLKISAEDLQEWRFVAERSGLAAGSVERSFMFLGRAVANNADTFKQLGIASAQSLPKGELLQKTIEGLAGIADETKRAELVSKLFTFRQAQEINRLIAAAGSIEELRKRKRQLGIITNEGAANAETFADAMTDFNHAIFGVKNEIGVGLLPVLSRLINRFTDWFITNRRLISQKVEAFVERIGKAFETAGVWAENFVGFLEEVGGFGNLAKLLALGLLISGSFKLIAAFKVLTPIVMGLAAAFKAAGLAGAIALAKPIAITAAIVAAILLVILVIEDLIQTFRGADTITRRIFENFKIGWAEIIKFWSEQLLSFDKFIRDTFGNISNWFDELKNNFLTGVTEIVDFWVSQFTRLKDFVSDIFEGITATFNKVKNLGRFIPGFNASGTTPGPAPQAPTPTAGRNTTNNISIGPASATFSGSVNNMNEQQLARELQRSQENVLDFQLKKALEAFAGGEL
jgi:hypothetical protein